ncbi:AAA family ATPase [Desulfovibrio sp. JC022]|uniref:AAA family ATPase n=1 Tax=Desulfovibrio sp. JC022 TaxID=2593642 RepID=UPI0013D0E3F6|nr:AAA family ATPase [Desulfovibrio sp. JC022]NDV21537.1 AAA family ATPase [Desulfovibrio sp. JC022]
MYLEKLSLHNYRGIRDMEIEFDRHLNVFVGDNGCGKTTIVAAIRHMLNGAAINSKTGTVKKLYEDELTIRDLDVSIGATSADNKLVWSYDSSIFEVLSSSNPEKIASSYRGTGSRQEAWDLDYLLLVAERERCSYDSSINVPIDEIVHKTSPFKSPETYAVSMIKSHEDAENAEFRLHVDNGNDPASFVLNPKLQAMKKAIAMITGFHSFSFNNSKNTYEASKIVNEDKIRFLFDQLSLGEQVFIGLAAAIAHEVVYSGKDEDNLLTAARLIIIDEIDLHLHPKWQRRIVPALRETFPNCQFIITTHSPQVLSEVPAENIFSLYRDENGDIQYEKPELSQGLNSSEILQEVMDLPAFSPEFEEELSRIYTLIEDEKFDEAKNLIEKYEAKFGDVPALIKARTVLELSE